MWKSIQHSYNVITYKASADLKSEVRRFYISYLWWVFGPTMEMVVFYVIFDLLLHRGTDNFIPFLLVGVTAWNWFGSTTIHCASSIVNSRALMQQACIHKSLFPIIVICTDTFKFLIAFAVVIIVLWACGLPPNFQCVYLPLIFMTQLFFIAAVGMICAGITPFFQDFSVLLNYIIRVMFFVSGIFYDAKSISADVRFYFFLNPMARLISSYRDVLIHGQRPDIAPLFALMAVSVFVAMLGWLFIDKHDKVYPRILF